MSQISVDKVKTIMSTGQIFDRMRTSNPISLNNYQTVKVIITSDYEEKLEDKVEIYALLKDEPESEEDVVKIAEHTFEHGQGAVGEFDVTADQLAHYNATKFVIQTTNRERAPYHMCSIVGIFSNPRYANEEPDCEALIIMDE